MDAIIDVVRYDSILRLDLYYLIVVIVFVIITITDSYGCYDSMDI